MTLDQQAHALSGLLAALGERAEPQLSSGACERAADIAGRLTELGWVARAVRLRLDALGTLRTPTLVFFSEQEAAVMHEASRTHVRAELPGVGIREWSLRELGAARECWAIELGGKRLERGRVVHQILNTYRAEARTTGLALSLGGLLALLSLLGPWLASQAMEAAVSDRAPRLLAALVAAAALIGPQRAVFEWLRFQALRTVRARLEANLLASSFGRLTREDFAQAQQRGVAARSQVLESSGKVGGSFTDMVFSPCIDVSCATAALLSVLYVLPPAALACGAYLALGVPLAGYTALVVMRAQRAELDGSARARGRLYELLTGITSFKVAGAERSAVARWLEPFLESRTLALVRERRVALLTTLLELGRKLVLLCVFTWGAQHCLEHRLSLGGLLAGTMLADSFGQTVQRLLRTLLSWATLRAELECANDKPEHSLAAAPATAGGHHDDAAIVLEDVWFRHRPDGPWVVRGLNLRVERGGRLHLGGTSGSGKTTTLRLIAGLYKPERGTVRVLGQDPLSTRHEIAYLPQGAPLLGGSILSTIQTMSDASQARIAAAAQATGLADWLKDLPMGFDTAVPPGGGTLSGGQRQSVLLTGLLASRRSIVLVDEGTSHLDPAWRKRLDLDRLFADRTLVSVSHDP